MKSPSHASNLPDFSCLLLQRHSHASSRRKFSDVPALTRICGDTRCRTPGGRGEGAFSSSGILFGTTPAAVAGEPDGTLRGHYSIQAWQNPGGDAFQKGQNKLNVQQRRLWVDKMARAHFPKRKLKVCFWRIQTHIAESGFSLKAKKSNKRALFVSCFSSSISRKSNTRI